MAAAGAEGRGGLLGAPASNEGDTIYNDSGVGSVKMQYCDGAKCIKIGGPNIAISGPVGYRKLDDGTVERLLNKYEKYPCTLLESP